MARSPNIYTSNYCFIHGIILFGNRQHCTIILQCFHNEHNRYKLRYTYNTIFERKNRVITSYNNNNIYAAISITYIVQDTLRMYLFMPYIWYTYTYMIICRRSDPSPVTIGAAYVCSKKIRVVRVTRGGDVRRCLFDLKIHMYINV